VLGRTLRRSSTLGEGKERQLRGHIGGALNQGITAEEIVESIVKAYALTLV